VTQYTSHIPPPCYEEVVVLHTDDHILVVVKPSGLLSVPGRIVKDCVINRLKVDHPEVAAVHRLDLDTSGLMVVSLSKLATSDLNRQFRERQINKQYVAVVDGEVKDRSGEIDLPIRADWENRPRQVIDHEAGKPSLTHYELLDSNAQQSRLLLKPVTGRSHQLRIHLAEIGHPILGCDLYAHEAAFKKSTRLMLHASSLEFSHPQSGERMVFERTRHVLDRLFLPIFVH
jgi:tRNA pseudouridine32 synthase/23S rRNA pseudouridine746 synthase